MFRCRDGAVQIAVGSGHLWRRFCEAVGLDSDEERFATNDDRVRNRAALIAVLEESFAGTDTDVLLAEMGRAGIPAGKVRSLDDVYASEQVESQGLLVEVDHARLGAVTLPGPPLRFFDHASAEVTRTHHQAPPVLDADGEAIRLWLSEQDST